eukprot:42641_1
MMLLVSRKFRITPALGQQILFLRSISNTSQVADLQIDNSKAIKLINYLYVNNRKKSKDKYKAIEEAFEIYHKIVDAPNYETIDTLLKLFFYFGLPHQYVSIWNDIERISSDTANNSDSICYAMLLKCCLESKHINTDDCLQVLSWIKHFNYELKIKESYIGKLIIHCSKDHNLEALDCMYNLFIEGLFECNAIFIKTTFINAYSMCHQLPKSIDIFTQIPHAQLNMICVGSMMKRYMDHECYSDALSLYDSLDALDNDEIHQNEYCDSMAIQSCIHSGNFDKGKAIHVTVNKKLYDKGKSELEMNDRVKHSLIGFYGEFGDITEAERLFNSMRNNHANMITLNCMMNAYIKNGADASALQLYKHALEKNELSNVLAIKACMNTDNMMQGKSIYAQMHVNNYHIKLKNILIEFFGRCGDVPRAEQMFESINPQRLSLQSIGAMMKTYIDNGYHEDGLQLYDDVMSDLGPNAVNNMCHSLAIKGAMNLGNYDKCEHIIRVNRIEDKIEDMELKNTLIQYYEHCGDLESSLKKMNLL